MAQTTVFRKEQQTNIQRDLLKRIFDISFSALLLILFSPLIFILSLLVCSTSAGPIFYRSQRLGRAGKIIHCLKLRTMYNDADNRLKHLLMTDPTLLAEWRTYQKLKLDPRITPIGKFLRKTSLDELPQFWNVLKGDLSIVGPRPPTLLGPPEYFWQEITDVYGKNAQQILSIRPGITGIWQISGRSQIAMRERIKMEALYAETHTFWTDLLVIVKTIPVVLFSKGAF